MLKKEEIKFVNNLSSLVAIVQDDENAFYFVGKREVVDAHDYLFHTNKILAIITKKFGYVADFITHGQSLCYSFKNKSLKNSIPRSERQ